MYVICTQVKDPPLYFSRSAAGPLAGLPAEQVSSAVCAYTAVSVTHKLVWRYEEHPASNGTYGFSQYRYQPTTHSGHGGAR